jgi:hypothetical protein
MVSTPNAPDGLFERIEKEPEQTCIYKRLFLDYTYGIGKIYTAEEIKPSNRHHLSENTISSIWERLVMYFTQRILKQQ